MEPCLHEHFTSHQTKANKQLTRNQARITRTLSGFLHKPPTVTIQLSTSNSTNHAVEHYRQAPQLEFKFVTVHLNPQVMTYYKVIPVHKHSTYTVLYYCRIRTHTRTRTRTHTRTNTRTHTRTNTRTNTRTHTRTYTAPSQADLLPTLYLYLRSPIQQAAFKEHQTRHHNHQLRYSSIV